MTEGRVTRPIVIRLDPLPGRLVVGRVEGVPELEAVGSTHERVLERLGRALDRRPAAAPAATAERRPEERPRRALPVVVGQGATFLCPEYAIELSRDECASRHARANTPAPEDPAEGAAWALVRVELGRCVGCPIGSACAGESAA